MQCVTRKITRPDFRNFKPLGLAKIARFVQKIGYLCLARAQENLYNKNSMSGKSLAARENSEIFLKERNKYYDQTDSNSGLLR